MSINNMPFYIVWETYIDFVSVNFPALEINDSALFLGFIILNIAFLFFIYFLIKVIKFVVVLGKNMIMR